MKKKIIIISILIIAAVLIIAAFTKPNDKKIKIETVNALWGDKVPSLETPQYYEQFMNTVTPDIAIDDWVFLKRIRYVAKDSSLTVGYGAFGKVMLRK